MGQQKITEKAVTQNLPETAHVLITQPIDQADGSVVESLRRVPLSAFMEKFGGYSSGGQPTAVATAADMTDTGKLYLYTGTEEGWNNGHWYYYYDGNWVDGGQYGATDASGVGIVEVTITEV